MSKYKLQFKLKQHTPIIHFQHDQFGATLRATELKPKLDRFLIKKLKLTKIIKDNNGKDKEVPKDEYKNWFINQGKEHLALDYKVRVNGDFHKKIIPEGRRNQYGAFFGTIGNEYRKNPKGLSFAKNLIDLNILCFNDALIKKIEENIIPFFEQTNFGTRQSKGFGSFTIVRKDQNEEKINVEFSNGKYKTFFEIDIPNENWFEAYKKISNDIVLLYKAIRSGINLKERNRQTNQMVDKFYFKSLMFLYAKHLGFQWEKKTIKEHFFIQELNNQKKKRPNSEPLTYSSETKNLMKDLLGLSSEESWFSYGATIKKKQAVRNHGHWQEINDNEQTFERFKSPIHFKPVLIRNDMKLRVYIFLNQDELDFALRENKDFMIRNGRNSFHISFPKKFSLNEFFNFFLDSSNFNISTHVESRYHNQSEYKKLKNYFNQLRKNIHSNNQSVNPKKR